LVYGQIRAYNETNEIIARELYVAIFYSGGGAAMYGVAEDTTIQNIARNLQEKWCCFYYLSRNSRNCLFERRKREVIYAGRKITGFPDKLENKEMEYYKAFPFSMDKAIKTMMATLYSQPKGKRCILRC
jgi:hypothetical protein